MKKIYEEPRTEAIEIELSGMLCTSGKLDGDANEPAHARELQDDAWNVILGASLIDDDQN